MPVTSPTLKRWVMQARGEEKGHTCLFSLIKIFYYINLNESKYWIWWNDMLFNNISYVFITRCKLFYWLILVLSPMYMFSYTCKHEKSCNVISDLKNMQSTLLIILWQHWCYLQVHQVIIEVDSDRNSAAMLVFSGLFHKVLIKRNEDVLHQNSLKLPVITAAASEVAVEVLQL